jgi:hypothetical protein
MEPRFDRSGAGCYLFFMRLAFHMIALPIAILAVWVAPSLRADPAADHPRPAAAVVSSHPSFARSQIMLVTTPEPRTAAAALCIAFVAALAARQIYLRRVSPGRIHGDAS